MYSSLITYSIYDLNSSLFLELIREVLDVEFTKQRDEFGNTFLPIEVKTDEYLVNPVSDLDINPAFCSVIKATSSNGENHFHSQSNEVNTYLVRVLADGLENLRKILDSVFIILNDMDIKSYLFTCKNSNGDKIISNDGMYRVNQMSNEFEEQKTINDKNIVGGYLTLQAEITETSKFNLHPLLTEANTELQVGPNKKSTILNTTI